MRLLAIEGTIRIIRNIGVGGMSMTEIIEQALL